MTKVIVASFKEEKIAIDALHKLKELDSFGDIALYESVLVRKQHNNDYEILKADSSEGWRLLTGMAVGGLLGALGGPIGLIIGLYTGTAIGAISDASHYNFAEDFVAGVENKMAAGTVSIIAEIDEESNVFIDEYLKPFDAVITRSDVDFDYDSYLGEEIDVMDDEITEERANLKKSIGEEKTKIEKKIAALKEKRKLKVAAFDAAVKTMATTIKDKAKSGVAAIEDGAKGLGKDITDAAHDAKANRIKKRIARHEARLSTLHKELDVLA